MLFLTVIHHYLLWHFSRAFLEIFHVWLNFLWFVIHFFSIPQLLKTWFSPWKRITVERGQAWNLEDLAGYIIVNFLSRVIGAIMRTIVITMGVSATLCTVIAGFLIYTFWVIAPVAIIGLIGFGLVLIFS